MASQEIDRLDLEINVGGLDKEQVKNVNDLALAINNLVNSIDIAKLDKLKDLGVKISSSTKQLSQSAKQVQDNAKAITKSSQALAKAQEIPKAQVGSGLSQQVDKVNEQTKAVKKMGEEWTRVSTTITQVDGEVSSMTKRYKDAIGNRMVVKSGEQETTTITKKSASQIADEEQKAWEREFDKTSKAKVKSIYKDFMEQQKAYEQGQLALEKVKIQQAIDSNKSFTKAQDKITKSAKGSASVFQEMGLTDFEKQLQAEENKGSKLDKIKEKIKGITKESKKSTSSLGKLFASIRRIALYRIIRGLIKSITQAFTYGIQQLAIVDKNFNQTMSNITSSFTKLKASLGLTLQPLIEVLEPIIIQINDYISNIANVISRINALEKGQTYYYKIKAKYTEDYAKSLQKASGFAFDTFNVLQSGESPLEKVEIDNTEGLENTKEIASWYQDIKDIANGIRDILVPTFKIIKSIIEDNKENIQSSINGVVYILNVVAEILKKIQPIIDFFDNSWLFQSHGWKFWEEDFWSYLKRLMGISNSAQGISLFGFGNRDRKPFTSFANGGQVGEFWRMNENGVAEMLYNSGNSNGTNVITQGQLSQAFANAIYQTGLLEAIQQGMVVNIDGREVASSKTFKREINRTNPSLNLR